MRHAVHLRVCIHPPSMITSNGEFRGTSPTNECKGSTMSLCSLFCEDLKKTPGEFTAAFPVERLSTVTDGNAIIDRSFCAVSRSGSPREKKKDTSPMPSVRLAIVWAGGDLSPPARP